MTTWYDLLNDELEITEEKVSDLISDANIDEWGREAVNGWLRNFTAWSDNYIYYCDLWGPNSNVPIVLSLPRNPPPNAKKLVEG